jgi:hypothetical protein
MPPVRLASRPVRVPNILIVPTSVSVTAIVPITPEYIPEYPGYIIIDAIAVTGAPITPHPDRTELSEL